MPPPLVGDALLLLTSLYMRSIFMTSYEMGGFMKECQFKSDVLFVPSVEDFGERFHQYKNYANGEGRAVFNLLTSPESLIYAIVATEIGLPAVAGIAEKSVQEIIKQDKKLTNFDKQFIGAVVCVLIEMNGYQKSGTKRAVPHKLFTKAEFYERKSDPPHFLQ